MRHHCGDFVQRQASIMETLICWKTGIYEYYWVCEGVELIVARSNLFQINFHSNICSDGIFILFFIRSGILSEIVLFEKIYLKMRYLNIYYFAFTVFIDSLIIMYSFSFLWISGAKGNLLNSRDTSMETKFPQIHAWVLDFLFHCKTAACCVNCNADRSAIVMVLDRWKMPSWIR